MLFFVQVHLEVVVVVVAVEDSAAVEAVVTEADFAAAEVCS